MQNICLCKECEKKINTKKLEYLRIISGVRCSLCMNYCNVANLYQKQSSRKLIKRK